MMAFTGIETFMALVGLSIVVDAFPNMCFLHPQHRSIYLVNGKSSTLVMQSSLSADIKSKITMERDNDNDNRNINGSRQTPAPKRKKKKIKRRSSSSALNPKNKVDLNFLQKRTSNLLHVTSAEYIASEEHLTVPDATTTTKKWKKADRRTFHWLMDSWAFSGQPDGADQALALLRRMESIRETHPHLAPDVRSYSKLINAYAKSGRKDAGDKAHSILDSMVQNRQLLSTSKDDPTTTNNTSPNTFLYTSVLEAYANSPSSTTAANKAESLCYKMHSLHETNPELSIRPTPRSFNAVINAWGRSPLTDSAHRAEAFLDAMELSHSAAAIQPLASHLTGTLGDTRPNTINYNSVINAWANSRSDDAPNRSERLLRRMQSLYLGGDPHVKPNSISFNACIDSWAKSGAEFAGRRAEEILNSMEELYKSGENDDVKPNTRSYNAVMNAYAKSRDKDAAQMAQRCLERMEEEYGEGNNDVKPDFFSFATVINAWGRSREQGKADYVLEIFRDMEEMYKKGNTSVRPNVVIFNAVINACAYTFGDNVEQNRAIEISNVMFKELEVSNYGDPDQVTYGTFLKVCNNQMPVSDTRNLVVSALLKKCIKDGQMGEYVHEQLRSMTTEEQFHDLVGMSKEKCGSWKDVPAKWRRNVVEGRRRNRRELF